MWAGGAGPKLTQRSVCFDQDQVQNGRVRGRGGGSCPPRPVPACHPVPSEEGGHSRMRFPPGLLSARATAWNGPPGSGRKLFLAHPGYLGIRLRPATPTTLPPHKHGYSFQPYRTVFHVQLLKFTSKVVPFEKLYHFSRQNYLPNEQLLWYTWKSLSLGLKGQATRHRCVLPSSRLGILAIVYWKLCHSHVIHSHQWVVWNRMSSDMEFLL